MANPKSIVFFAAFLPQFLDATAPALPQMVVCKPAVQRAVNRTGGSLLIGAGLLAVAWRKS